MSLLEDLIESTSQGTLSLERSVVGPAWTLVVSSTCGIAAKPPGRQAAERVRPPDFSQKPLGDLLPLAYSSRPSEASLGVAALNALLKKDLKPTPFRSYSIPRAGGKSVGLVGEFSFVEQIRSIAAEVLTIETDAAEAILPGVDIAIISGDTIVDHSMERLLEASRPCYTIVFGPSTPLSPLLFEYGADQLVGVTVENHEEAAKWITSDRENLMECPGLKSVVLRK